MEGCRKINLPHPLERKVISSLETKTTVSLADLGGATALYAAREELALSPILPELIEITLSGFGELSEESLVLIRSFFVFCLTAMPDEFAVQETVEILERCRPLPAQVEQDCFTALLDSARDSKKTALTRALCLEGALRFTVDFPTRKHQLLKCLLGVSNLEDAEYLRRVARIAGVAYSLWREPELISMLEGISGSDPAISEASFELGLATLAKAFDAGSSRDALDHFITAKKHFELSMQSEEDHPEAEAYSIAIGMLLAFHAKKPHDSLNAELERLRRAVIIFQAWHSSTLSPAWATARNVEMAHWHTLAAKLEALSSHLAEPSWLEPAIVIEQTLLYAYAASRTIFRKTRSGGIEILARPRIVASIISAAGQLYAVFKWLEIHQTEEESSPALHELHVQIKAHLADVVLGNASASTAENFKAAIPHLSKIAENSPAKVSILEQMMADQLALQRNDCNPCLDSILGNCFKGVSCIQDYQETRVRKTFHAILLQSLKYLESRMDLTRVHAPRLSFLFDPGPGKELPLEKELQQDYYYFMYGNVLAGDTKMEMSDVASGRADVYFSFGAIRYVAEIKRELNDCSFEALRSKYLGQAAEYQNTNVKLGFLLVLDLTEKRMGGGDMKAHVKVEILDMPEPYGKRAVVVLRVPGRRKTPSEVKVRATKLLRRRAKKG